MMNTILFLIFSNIYSSTYFQKDPETLLADKYLEKGFSLLLKAEYDSTVYYFQKSADIYYQKELWQKYAECLNNISSSNYKTGNYDVAISYARQALKVCNEKTSSTDQEASRAFNTLGNIYRNKGNYSLALEYYVQSKDINIKSLGKTHLDVTKSYNNMAIAYGLQGNYEKSIQYFRQVLEIRKKILEPKHRLLTNSYNNIGITYWERGAYDSALIYHNKTLQIRKETLGNHPLTGNSLNNIGAVYEMTEEYELALKYYQQALTIFHEVFGSKHPLINSTALNIGDVYYKSDQLDLALEYYQEAIISVSGKFSNSDPTFNPSIDAVPNLYDLILPLSSKASVFEKKYAKLKDIKYLHYALQTIKKCDSTIVMVRQQQGDIDKLTLGAQIKSTYETAISICLKLYELTDDPLYANLILYFMEQSKASVLLQATSDLTAKNFGGIPTELLEKEHALKETQGMLKSQLLEATHEDSSSKFKSKLFQANRMHDSLIAVFEKRFPYYFELRYNTKIATINEVQSQILSDDQLLLEYFLGDNHLYLMAIGKKNFKIVKTAIDSTFDIHYKQFLKGVKSPKSVNQNIDQFKSYTQSAYALYQTLLGPLDDSIENKELIVVPDGKLALIPMDALLTQSVDSKNINYSMLPYVLKSHTVSYANSSTTLLNNIKTHRFAKKPIKVIAFAPSFKNDLRHLNQTSKIQNRLSPLNWNNDEVKMLESYFKVDSYTGSSASEAAFKEKAEHFNIIHIASHALIDDENPMNSKIAFTMDTRDSLNDGYLHTFELYNSQVNADMVVLSACNTGYGNVQKGEGVMSLGYAFAYAGVPNILMSHWQIDDKSTYLLMDQFYKNLSQGMKKNEALREAKLSLLADTKIAYANPYYWGAFVLYGDTYPVAQPTSYGAFIYIGLALFLVITIFIIRKFRNSDNH